jgi:YHS domain-containing protein
MTPTAIVNAYLAAYASGDVERAASLVSEDFCFQGPMRATTGRSALRDIAAHVAPHARGHRILQQWQNGDEVCTIYELNVETGTEATSLLVSEWDSVRDGLVTSSLMLFDTAPFQRVGRTSTAVVDPVCGMTVDPATAAAHRRYGQCDYYFCAVACADAFDAEPERHLSRRP